MYCRKCGKQILDDSSFCQYCGTKVEFVEKSYLEQELILTADEAEKGVLKDVLIEAIDTSVKVKVPAKILNGQKLRIHNLKFTDKDGKKIKRDLYLNIIVK